MKPSTPGDVIRALATPLAAALLSLATGCTSLTGTPLTTSHPGDDADAQMAFWHALPSQPVATNDDAFHAILLAFDGSDPNADYDSRRGSLMARGWLSDRFGEPAEQAVSRGTLAQLLMSALQIKGGLTTRVLGPAPRYALRELQYVGIFPASSDGQVFTGEQLLSLIGRVEDYRVRVALAAGQDVQTALAPAPAPPTHVAGR